MSAPLTPRRILSLPGWRSSDERHWQTLWEAQRGHLRVEQSDWEWPRRGDWMARLDEVLSQDTAPTVLVAHSLGCQLVASWAAHSKLSTRVCAALLVAPADTEREDLPPQLFNWRPIIRQALPFPSLVVASRNDRYCQWERAVELASGWGSQLMNIGDQGHLNSDSGLADWPQGLLLLDGFLQSSLVSCQGSNVV